MKTAGPSYAVKLLGLNGVPEAGDEFNSVDNEKAARELAEDRGDAARQEKLDGRAAGVLRVVRPNRRHHAKVLKVIVKADTQGSARPSANPQ